MTKRILALSLCLVMLCGSLFGCAKNSVLGDSDMGAYITMYLTDEIYDFDPANAYYNTEAVNVLSMMYETLFTLDEDGNVKKSLVDSYKIVEDDENEEYYIEFTLKEAYWSVKDRLTAEHVVFAWKRLVDFRYDFDAASLLFDIKNARAIKEGDIPVDDLGVEAVESDVVKVSFEKPIDYDQFMMNLTSVATAPLLDRFVSSNPDWAKKGTTMATSGPFKLGKISYVETGDKAFDDNAIDANGNVNASNYKVKKIEFFYLERNLYYYRDLKHDSYDASVKPYRLLVDCTKTDEEILQDFKDGKLFYIGDLPLSLRTGENGAYVAKNAEITDALSTFSIELNQNALINDGERGTYLFANETVRKALSKVIDREAIAEEVGFVVAADAFVSNGIFDEGTKALFRTSNRASSYLNTSAEIEEAKALLSNAGIDAGKYSFSIKVAAYDDVQVKMTEMVGEAWNKLGFNVTVEKVAPIQNNDYFKQTDSTPPDVCDDLFLEDIERGTFEAIALDVNAFTADAYSMLSNYAYAFSGSFYTDADNGVYEYDTHITGYNSVEYNILMEAIYYIPYFADVNTLNSDYLSPHLTVKPYVVSATATMRKLSAAIDSAKKNLETCDSILNPKDEDAEITAEQISMAYTLLNDTILGLEQAVKTADKNIVEAKCDQSYLNAVSAATKDVIASTTNVCKAINDATAAVDAAATMKATDKDKAEKLENALVGTRNALNVVTNNKHVLKAEIVLEAVSDAKTYANSRNLRQEIQKIYADNEIKPSASNKSEWSKQKSILLHKAEEMLMDDLPVIPVVYNKNVVLIHDDLSNVGATYYAPAYFRKTKLKDYEDYFYYSEEDKKYISIYKSFPEVQWDMIEK